MKTKQIKHLKQPTLAPHKPNPLNVTLSACSSEWEKTAEHKLQPKLPIFQMKKKTPKLWA